MLNKCYPCYPDLYFKDKKVFIPHDLIEALDVGTIKPAELKDGDVEQLWQMIERCRAGEMDQIKDEYDEMLKRLKVVVERYRGHNGVMGREM